MKLSELLVRVNLAVPNIKTTGISDDEITTLLNQACDEVNLLGKFYQGYTDFDIVSGTFIYNLSTVCPNYLGMSKKPLLIKDGDRNWTQIIPKTAFWIESFIPNWRDASSADIAQYYWIEGDELGIYPPIDEARTDSGRLYHLKKATAMSNNDHYPWSGATTEISAFKPLDHALIAFCMWKLGATLNEKTQERYSWEEFLKEVQRGMRQVLRRPDLTSDPGYVMNGAN